MAALCASLKYLLDDSGEKGVSLGELKVGGIVGDLYVQPAVEIQVVHHPAEGLPVMNPPVLADVGQVVVYHFVDDDVAELIFGVVVAVADLDDGIADASPPHVALKAPEGILLMDDFKVWQR